eukprot:Gb_17951 [translate_table: standard]
MFGYGTKHPIIGRGIISVTIPNREVKKFGNVLHVPILTKSFLSIIKIADVGMIVHFDSIGCMLKNRNGDLVTSAVREGDLYKLQMVHVNIVLEANIDGNKQRRLVHLNLSRFGMSECDSVATPMEVDVKLSKVMSPSSDEEIPF